MDPLSGTHAVTGAASAHESPADTLPVELQARVVPLHAWLGNSQQQLQLALDAARLGMWQWNLLGNEHLWSDRCRSLLGVAADTRASLDALLATVHVDDRNRVADAIDVAIRKRTELTAEFRVVLQDGELRWLQALGRVDADGALPKRLCMSVVLRDVTDQHRASAAWASHQQYLQQLVRAAPVGVAKFDRQLRFVAVNGVFAEGLRLSEPGILGRRLYDVLPELPASWREANERGLAGIPLQFDGEPLTRADGSVDWIARKIIPWRDQHNEVGGIVMLADILTQRRQLEQQERMWASAFTHNAHGMAIVDASSGTLHSVNAAFGRLVGHPPQHLTNSPFIAHFAQPEAPLLKAVLADADASGSIGTEATLCHRDGTAIPAHLDLVSVRAADGSLQYRIVTITDLRDRQRIQAELHQQATLRTMDQRFRLLAESAPIGIVIADPGGKLTYANPAWLALTALPLGQALDCDWLAFVHPDDRERVQSTWLRTRHGTIPPLEFRYLRPSGEVRWVHSYIAVLKDDAGRTEGYLRTSVDVTERLQDRAASDRIHSQVRTLAQRLQELREVEAEELAAHLRHGIYLGLTQLQSDIQELGRVSDPGTRAGLIYAKLRAVADATVESLRHVMFDLKPPSVGELGFARAMHGYLEEQRSRSRLAITLSLPDGPLNTHQQTLAVLYAVTQEAVSNAIAHAQATTITVQLDMHSGSTRLRVSDDGIGIGEKDRFRQGCIGLLAIQERLAQIGGTLRVLGSAGHGTKLEASVPQQWDRRPLLIS